MSYVALITGASAGIGEATARRLAREADVELVLVARREERLRTLARELGGATVIAEDLTDPGSHGRIADAVTREHGMLHMLVNNAGASWRGTFADTGWDNVARHLAVDFEAPVRLTEALLGLLRRTAAGGSAPAEPNRRVCIVNVSSTAGRIARPESGAYSAAKFALAGWTDSLRAEERPYGVHVGLVLPGFVATEGFPATELVGRRLTRRLVSRPEVTAEAILDAGPRGHAERYTPRAYGALAVMRTLAPGLARRAVQGGAFTTTPRPRDQIDVPSPSIEGADPDA